MLHKNARLAVKNLCAGYKNHDILKNVSLEIKSGELTCLCGKNGCGKSTLFSVLAKLTDGSLKVRADDLPSIFYDNDGCGAEIFEIYKENRKKIARKIAFMQQNEYSVWDFSVLDFVMAGRFAFSKNGNYCQEDYKIAGEVLKKLNLEDFRDKKIHSVSGGEFQKIRIARALVQQPDFLLLDEPANNIDFTYETKMMDLLKKISWEENIGVFIIIHDLNIAARYADKIILLGDAENSRCTGNAQNGTEDPEITVSSSSHGGNFLISGTAGEVFTQENLYKAFGTELQTYIHPIYNCIQVYEK